ncbi:condensation domain-containing protein [Salinispora fenicalii]|uniref:condensation domain-containing protein n=1 Tax=Salinispora fenicalii TaxID=1137263 RepID=UPI001CC68B48|nr:condensation domain-containing protein [Salinispora fenicalii]
MNTRQTPASVSQRLLWMIKHYRADFGALSCPLLCRLTGDLDANALDVALTRLAARHESLRTTFTGRGARLAQIVHPPAPVPTRRIYLSDHPDPDGAVDEAVRAELRTAIDPTEWPARTTLWRLGARTHLLCLNLHHLVTDAWSTGILFRDLGALYAQATGASSPLPDTGWPYTRFVEWQQELLDGDGLQRHRDYWRRQLAGSQLPALPAAADDRPTNDDRSATADVAIDLDRETVTRLRALARTRHTTLFAVLLAVFYHHLHQVTGQDDLAVASMFANRSRPELRETVGLLANMVLLRARVGQAATFADLVGQAHSAAIGAFTYQDLPYQMLPADVVRAGGRRADDVLFNVMAEAQHRTVAAGVGFELLVPRGLGSRFRFELAIAPMGPADLRVVFYHPTAAYTPAQAHRFLSGYADLATTLTAAPTAPLGTARPV